MQYIFAKSTAMTVTNVQCRRSEGSNSWMGVGGLLGSFQNGYPFLVLASRG